MKLLWVTAKRLASDLASTTQLSVSNTLSERGWEVTIMAPNDSNAKDIVENNGHNFIGVKRSKKAGLGWLTFGKSVKQKLPQVIDQFDVALVDWQAVAGASKPLNNHKIPWLVVDRSPPVFNSIIGRLQWLEYLRAWKIAKKKKASGSVLKSQALADFHRSKNREINPITIMEAGVDVSKFTPTNFSGTTVIVHHGQLDQERDIQKLVSIGEILYSRKVDFTMKIAGRGNKLPSLQKLSNLHDWLEVLGPLPQKEIPKFLASGHLAIFPLPDNNIWRLASPLKVREWAAAGLPMILSDITPHQSIGERNWINLVPPNYPLDNWADQVESFIGQDLHSIGAQARKYAELEFDWKKTTEQLHLQLMKLKGLRNDKT